MKVFQFVIAVLLIITGVIPLESSWASVANGFVSGTVDVKTRVFSDVTAEDGSYFFPGHLLTIVTEGQVDINPQDRWEEECIASYCFNRRNWIDHHFHTAEQWSTDFRLIDDAGQALQGAESLRTEKGRLVYLVPPDSGSGFNRKFRLQAMIADSVPAIDPVRSQNQFKITVSVDTSQRREILGAFLSKTKANAKELRGAWLRDPFFLDQNRQFIAKALVVHAKTLFPPEAVETADAHNELLQYAGEIDPLSNEPNKAIAEMFLAQGKPEKAEEPFLNIIKKIKAVPEGAENPFIQLELAQSYLGLAKVMELGRGYLQTGDLATIIASYGNAISIASRFRAPILQAEALLGRAYALRSRNTSDSLKAAASDLKSAQNLSPITISGTPLAVAPGRREMLAFKGPLKLGVSWRSNTEPRKGDINVYSSTDNLIPLAVSRKGKVLALSGGTLGWTDLASDKPLFKSESLVSKYEFDQPTIARTNGNISIIIRMTDRLLDGARHFLLRSNLEPAPILINGKPPLVVELASEANRYVLISEMQPGSSQTAELRDVSPGGEAVRCKADLGNITPPMLGARISPDGKWFGFMLVEPQGQRVLVWDDKCLPIEISKSEVKASNTGLSFGDIVDFDFTPDGKGIVAVDAHGAIGMLEIKKGSKLQSISLKPSDIIPEEYLFSPRLQWASSNVLVVETQERDKLRAVTWDSKGVHIVVHSRDRIDGDKLGYWMNKEGRLGTVKSLPQNARLMSIRFSDGAILAESPFESLPTEAHLLNGGRFLCYVDRGLEALFIKDLITQENRLVEKLDQRLIPGLPFQFIPKPLCWPTKRDGEWILVSGRQAMFGFSIQNLVKFVGLEKKDNGSIPQVPADILEKTEAFIKSSGGNKDHYPTQYTFSHSPYVSDDQAGSFAIADYPTMPPQSGKSEMKSLPYFLIENEPFQIKRMLLPPYAIPILLTGPDLDKVIYRTGFRTGLKIFIKDVSSDNIGTELLDTASGSFAVAPPVREDLQIRSQGTRFLYSRVAFGSQGDTAQLQHMVFDTSKNGEKIEYCANCEKRDLPKSLFKWFELQGLHSPGFNLVPMDNDLRYIAVYGENQAIVHDLATKRPIASLPSKRIFWLGPDRVFYESGKDQFSILQY